MTFVLFNDSSSSIFLEVNDNSILSVLEKSNVMFGYNASKN